MEETVWPALLDSMPADEKAKMVAEARRYNKNRVTRVRAKWQALATRANPTAAAEIAEEYRMRDVSSQYAAEEARIRAEGKK